MKAFEWSTKRSFKNRNDKSTIRFGTIRDNDKKHGIICGQMALAGFAQPPYCSSAEALISPSSIELATMFDPSVDAIVAAAKSQCEASTEKISVCRTITQYHVVLMFCTSSRSLSVVSRRVRTSSHN